MEFGKVLIGEMTLFLEVNRDEYEVQKHYYIKILLQLKVVYEKTNLVSPLM